MATIEQNRAAWDGQYDWPSQGDEWSEDWGGAESQWFGSLFPRLRRYLPAPHILELAPGYGRWTQFLAGQAESLTLVDLSEECIEACKKRFSKLSHVEYFTNDGKTLDMIPGESIDFVYSFDSLVHADASALKSYVKEIDRILKPGGHAFIHHSNLGQYQNHLNMLSAGLPKYLLKIYWGTAADLHWRDKSMSGEKLIGFTKNTSLHCVSQEKLNWRTKRALIDCISVLKKNHEGDDKTKIYENYSFMDEADIVRKLSANYGDL